MSSNTIKIKLRISDNENKRDLWNKITSTLTKHSVIVSKLITNRSGDSMSAVLSTINDADKIFQTQCLIDLGNINVTPMMTPELKAQRTIMAYNVDEFVYSESEHELIHIMNSSKQYEAESVHKLRNNSLKITFRSIENATKVLQHGLRICNISIPATSLRRDRYVNVTFCYKCYSMDGHTSKDCNKPADFKICSTCSDTTHTFNFCNAPQDKYKCVNCKGNHKTTSYACKDRKLKETEIIRRLNGNSTPAKSYASTAKSNIQSINRTDTNSNNINNTTPVTTIPSYNAQIMKDITHQVSTTLTCIILAQAKSNSTQDNFDNILQKLLSLNDIKKFSFGDIEPPKLFDSIAQLNLEPQMEGSIQQALPTEVIHQNSTANISKSSAQTASNYNTPNTKLENNKANINKMGSDANDSESEIYKTPNSSRTTAADIFMKDVAEDVAKDVAEPNSSVQSKEDNNTKNNNTTAKNSSNKVENSTPPARTTRSNNQQQGRMKATRKK